MDIKLPSNVVGLDYVYAEEPPINKPPVISISESQTVNANTATISGNASDPDGLIVETDWQLMGGSGTITSRKTLTTTVTNLGEGTNTFRFVAIDNNGAAVYKETTVIYQKVAEPPPAGNYGTLVLDKKFNKASDITESQLGEGGFSTKDGGCFKSLVTGAVNQSQGYRSEQQYGSFGNEIVVEYEVNHENWGNLGQQGHDVQFHPDGTGLSAVIGNYAYDGKRQPFRCINGSIYTIDKNGKFPNGIQNIPSNVWETLRWEIKWHNSAGYARLYVNNELYWDFVGQTKFESVTPYFKLGQNRWLVSKTTVVYYRNLKVWKKS